jgi:glycosyltransferase involved in cell wall biosynthesis
VTQLRTLRVLVVLATATRRGAEIEGLALADVLPLVGPVSVELVALAPAAPGAEPLPVQVLGSSARSASSLRELRRRARDVDLVVAFGSTALPACAVALAGTGTRFVYRSIGDPGHWVRGPLHRARTGVLMRRAVHVVALWEGARRRLIDLYRLDPSRVTVIPNGRAAERFRLPSAAERQAARAQVVPGCQEAVVVYLGALSAEKRVERAIEAIAAVPGVALVVAGDGPARPALEDLAARVASGRVRFLGLVEDPVPVLHAADALILTSTTEGMPGAVIEALLCGVPVVAPRVGALGELVGDGVTGRLTEDGGVQATAAALGEVLSETFPRGSVLRSEIRERLDLEVVARRWAALLAELAP